jgi:DNA-binding PadR family transcriptional regulator
MVEAEWGESENKRKAKYYAITRSGQGKLASETANWARLSAAIARVIETA